MAPGPPANDLVDAMGSPSQRMVQHTANSPVTILLTSALKQVSLMRCFRDAAEETGIGLRIIAVHNSPEASAACLFADLAFRVPKVQEDDYIEVIMELCSQHGIALVVPGAPYELAKLAAAESDFSKIGTNVVTGSRTLVDLSRDVTRLNELAFAAGAARKNIASRAEISSSPKSYRWPLTAIPKFEQNYPLGKLLLRHPRELSRIPINAPVVFTSNQQGDRVAVQMLFDTYSKLIFAAPFAIGQIADEDAYVAESVDDPEVMAISERLADMLPPVKGPLYIEFIRNADGDIFLDTMSPMLSRYYPLVDRAGAKIATWLIGQVLSGAVSDCFQWEVGLKMVSYHVPLFLFENKRSALQ